MNEEIPIKSIRSLICCTVSSYKNVAGLSVATSISLSLSLSLLLISSYPSGSQRLAQGCNPGRPVTKPT
jgi:hypothetical protein